MANSNWSRQEVEVVVTDYLEMLKLDLSGIKYNKAEHRRKIIPLLNDRSHGSIESKHQNISAVLIELGRVFIPGYKPLSKYQNLLKEVIIERLPELVALDPLMEKYSRQIVSTDLDKLDFHKWLVEPPEPSDVLREPKVSYGTIKRNYIEEEQRNKSIGDSGERLAFEFEKLRLSKLGKPSLVKSLKWVSRELGDGAGYDILSKNEDGSDRFIEVKSTTLSINTPIYFTKRENDFATENPDQFYLYRVFDLRANPKMFQRKGAFSSYLHIEAQSFKGTF
ncbi:MAG: DUF3883 domain-containing protein [Roseivirga sp.]